MNELQVFENPDFGQVRTVTKDGEPWFVAKDVCKAFGDTNHNRSVGRIDEEDKETYQITDSMGRIQQAIIVNESGLYALLFAMQPQKANRDGVSDAYPIETQKRIDSLHKFKRWITHEVIPSIRKHGVYATDETIDRIIADPDFGIKLLGQLKQEREARFALETQTKEDAPKVLFAKSVECSNSEILIGELAKILKQNGADFGQKRLFERLRQDGYLISRKGSDWNMPTQKSMDLGVMRIKETTVTHADGHVIVSKTPKITGKGQIYFVNRYAVSN